MRLGACQGWRPREALACLKIAARCALVAPAMIHVAHAAGAPVVPVPVPVTLAVKLSLRGLHPAATSGALHCGAVAQTADWVTAHRSQLTDYANVSRFVLSTAHYFGHESLLRFPITNRSYEGTVTFTTTLSPQELTDSSTRAPYRPGPSVLAACWLMLNGAPAVVDASNLPVVIAPGNVAIVHESPLAAAVGDVAAGGSVSSTVPVAASGLFFAPGPVTAVANVQPGPAGASTATPSGLTSGMATHLTTPTTAAGVGAACACTGATGPAGPAGPPGPPGPAAASKDLVDKIAALQIQLDALKAMVSATNVGAVNIVSVTAPMDRKDSTGRDYSHAITRNQSVSIGESDTETIGVDRTETIGGNRSDKILKAWSASVGTNFAMAAAERAEVQGGNAYVQLGPNNLSEKVPGNFAQSVGLNRSVTVSESDTLSIGKGSNNQVGSSYALSAGTTMNLTAATALSLQSGGVSLQLGKADEVEQIAGNYTQTVGKSRSVTVEGIEATSIGGASTAQVGGAWQLTAGKSVVVNAGDGITFMTGSSSVTLAKDGTIAIKGSSITIESSGALTLKAGGVATLTGSKVITK